ncbi:MAG: aminoglycoside phosphotransferase family protein [Candidatus Ozemobacteraceae bacterium]
MNHLFSIADQFNFSGKVTEVQEFGNGNINQTFLVSLDSSEAKNFILQRINTRVFHHPELVMANMRTLSEHVGRKRKDSFLSETRRWDVPQVLLTREAKDHFVSDGSFWRAITFVDKARSYETIQNTDHAREVGWALGMFHSIICDLQPDKLFDTLEGFHITPRYVCHYDEVAKDQALSPEEKYCVGFVDKRRGWTGVLEDAKADGKIPLRPIHGDPKVNNIMMDPVSGKAVSFVDLDTVKPGLVHYDIGDCLRSGCNPLGEEVGEWESVHFDCQLCFPILQGYLSVAGNFLTDQDYHYIYDSIRLITFELGLRFFTDHLEGNTYFKARHPNHNLQRALVQFKLCESIESQENSIQSLIKSLI